MSDKPVDFDKAVVPENKIDLSQVASKDTLDALTQLKNDTEKQYLEYFKKLASQEEYVIGGRTWKRRKLSYKEYREIEKLTKEANKDSNRFDELQEQVYRKLASYCLIDTATNIPMTPEQFENSEAELITKVLDAINFRTQSGLPSFQKA